MATHGAKRFACVCHVGAKNELVLVDEHFTFDEFVAKICKDLQISPFGKTFSYTVKDDPSTHIELKHQSGLEGMFYISNGRVDIYIEGLDAEFDSLILRSHRGSNDVQGNYSSITTRNDMMFADSTRCMDTSLASHEETFEASSTLGIDIQNFEKGQYFDSPSDFREALSVHAAKEKFSFKYIDNKRSYYRIICTVPDCKWKLTAGCEGKTNLVRVKSFKGEHTHTAQDTVNYKPVVRTKVLGAIFKKKVSSNRFYLPRQICRDMEDSYKIKLSYGQGWRAKEHAKDAIDGKAKDSYKFVPWMCERLISAIPGTTAEWTCSDDGKFARLFVAYGCSIHGFLAGCRPVIFVDACFLKGPYLGSLFSATAQDADDGLYPVAYGVLSSENDEDWLWFMQKLKESLGEGPNVIVTDRNKSLIKAVAQVYDSTMNAWCLRHLKENFSNKINTLRLSADTKKSAMRILDDCAYARSARLFDIHVGRMQLLDERLSEWVIAQEPSHWSNGLFPYRRWDKLYTNVAESFNAWILHERRLGIFNFMVKHAERTTDLLLRKKLDLNCWSLPVGKNIENKIKACQTRGLGFSSVPATDDGCFTVYDRTHRAYGVSIPDRECSCREWQMSGIPCPHVCAAVVGTGFNIFEMVDEMLTKERQVDVYSQIMSPIPLHDIRTTFEELEGEMLGPELGLLLPPDTKRPAGRPRVSREESQFQGRRVLHCSRCFQPGHKKTHCKEPMVG